MSLNINFSLNQQVKEQTIQKGQTASPLISIIIPFYNRQAFLAEAVESVIGQTFSDWELLLVDDGSTDNSAAIAQKFADRYPAKIRLLQYSDKRNKGASAARNLGARHAAGEYLTFLDSDDVFFPYTLEKEMEGFELHPEADAVCGTAMVWYSWLKKKGVWNKDFKIDLVLETQRLYEAPELFLHNLNASGRKPHFNATLLKRSFVDRIGAFEEEFKSVGEDQALWAKVSLHGSIFVLNDSLAKYRQHPDSTCANLLLDGKDIENWELFFSWLEDYLTKNGITDAEVWEALDRFRKRHGLEKRLRTLKNLYRWIIPLHLRYKVRDYLTRFKEYLAGPAHR